VAERYHHRDRRRLHPDIHPEADQALKLLASDSARCCTAEFSTRLIVRRTKFCLAQRGGVVVGIDSVIIMIIVGAIAGWLAGKIVRGFGFGLLLNIIIGIVGAFIGVWLLKQLHFEPFTGFWGSIVNATIGAVILLFIIGLIRR
jgi:uncharacterized membrane protein YeaQ/YmgE (transglycosylase-associated protein family)